MEVADGYVLTASDYPSGMGMSSITWEQYTSPIHSDITINGSYSWGGMGTNTQDGELVGSGEGEVTDPIDSGAKTASVSAAATTTTTVTDYDYIYNGGQLTGEVITTTVDGTVTNTETLYYAYDASGTPESVKYNNTLYFYVTNLQGDVTAILNSSGTIVVEYTYDAWGYIRATSGSMASTLGRANALRYRGYVYDRETGLYYLQSRYYNPGTGRFINADTLISTGQGILGCNMFAYCRNNPVCRKDISGTTDEANVDDGTDLLDEEKSFEGGKTSNGGFGGSGVKGGKLTFKSEAALKEHYEKHNPQFGNAFSTPQEYVDTANYVIETGTYVPSQNAYVKFYGMNGGANFAFVGVSHCRSYITTFHLKHVSQIQF